MYGMKIPDAVNPKSIDNTRICYMTNFPSLCPMPMCCVYWLLAIEHIFDDGTKQIKCLVDATKLLILMVHSNSNLSWN